MKKGQVGYLVDIIAFFGLITILIAFSIIFSFISADSEFEAHTQLHHQDASMQVMEVLQTPVEIDGYEATYGEFIALAENNEEIKDKVKEKLDHFLERIDNSTGRSICFMVEEGDDYTYSGEDESPQYIREEIPGDVGSQMYEIPTDVRDSYAGRVRFEVPLPSVKGEIYYIIAVVGYEGYKK